MAKEMSKKARGMLIHVWADIHKSSSKSPVFSKQLEKRYKISGAEVRSVVHRLRDEGKPICSGADGYYLAKDLVEARHTINHLRSRANSMLETARSMEEFFTREDQQVLL